jgi:hypothetical protein
MLHERVSVLASQTCPCPDLDGPAHDERFILQDGEPAGEAVNDRCFHQDGGHVGALGYVLRQLRVEAVAAKQERGDNQVPMKVTPLIELKLDSPPHPLDGPYPLQHGYETIEGAVAGLTPHR